MLQERQKISLLTFSALKIIAPLLFFFSGVSFYPFSLFKYMFFLTTLILMLFLTDIKKIFYEAPSIILGLLLFLIFANWAFRFEHHFEYTQLSTQVVFLIILYNFLIQQKEKNSLLAPILDTFSNLAIFCIAFFVLIFNFISYKFSANLHTGFGGGKILFTIWLSQFLILIYLRNFFKEKKSNDKKRSTPSINDFYPIAVILILITLLASITSILISLLIIFYFSFLKGGFPNLFKFGLISIFIIKFTDYFLMPLQPQLIIDNPSFSTPGMNRFYIIDLSHYSSYFMTIDKLSSGRLSLIANGISSLNLSDVFIGKGFENFKVDPSKPLVFGAQLDVHNIFVRILGEFGLAGLTLLLLLFLQPFFGVYKNRTSSTSPLNTYFFVLLVYILVSMTQPAFIFYMISPCLLFWILYAEVIKLKRM